MTALDVAAAKAHDGVVEVYTSANAPRLAGMSDWYLLTQLGNFKHGARGHNLQDPYGPQMSSMAAMLSDDHEMADLAGYVNSLR